MKTLNEIMNYIYIKQIETGYTLTPWGFKEVITIVYEIDSEINYHETCEQFIDKTFKEYIEEKNTRALYGFE